MAIVSVPLVKVYLVERVGGGALLHAGGGYVANTLIPASVVEAFGSASSALATLGASAASLASSPYVIAGAAVAVVALGAYCYFYGIPAPIESALASAGLAKTAKLGVLVPIAKMAAALVLLGLAGLVSFNFYKRLNEAKAAVAEQGKIDLYRAQATAEAAFSKSSWQTYGEAMWLGLNDTGAQLSGWADSLLSSAKGASTVAGDAIVKPARRVGLHLAHAYIGALSWLKRRFA